MKTALLPNRTARFHGQLCGPAEVSALQGSGGLSAWLSADEQARVARLRSMQRRHDWLAGRLAAKRAATHFLARKHQLAIPVSQITIGYDRQGRPVLRFLPAAEPQYANIERIFEELSLSLAHSDGWGLAAVAHRPSAGAIGVDLQRIRPVRVDLARRMLNAGERLQLSECFPGRENEGLLVYWAIKEAALKALGSGLRLPMKALHAELASQGGHAELRAKLLNGPFCAEARYWAEPEGFQAAVVFLKD